MRKYRWFLLVPVSLLLMAGLAVVRLTEYAETGRCYRDGSTLSADELRERVIRGLLTAEMRAAARENTYKTYVKAFLVPQSLTSHDVIQAVVSKSIVNLPKQAVYPITNEREIAHVDPAFLRSDFSIIQYGGGYVFITPSQGLAAVDSNVARQRINARRKHGFQLSWLERALGYGHHYFQVEFFSHINLGCCEDRYREHPKSGLSPEWYTREIVRGIEADKGPLRSHLIVSNCGNLLHRQQDGYTWYRF